MLRFTPHNCSARLPFTRYSFRSPTPSLRCYGVSFYYKKSLYSPHPKTTTCSGSMSFSHYSYTPIITLYYQCSAKPYYSPSISRRLPVDNLWITRGLPVDNLWITPRNLPPPRTPPGSFKYKISSSNSHALPNQNHHNPLPVVQQGWGTLSPVSP